MLASMGEPKVAVLGAGSWGTALAKLVADKGIETRLWARREAQARAIEAQRVNATYLPGASLPPSLHATASLSEALKGAGTVICAVPTHGLRTLLEHATELFEPDAALVSATKGIEQGTLKMVSDVFDDHLPVHRRHLFTAVAGPSFAKEVAQGIPTAVSVAGRDAAVRSRVQDVLGTERFRVYDTEDVVGVELGGALKNVIAIAAGIADGLSFGHNTRAGLITRGLAEITRLATRLGAHPQTMAGLSGMGDLVLTCTGDLSRNRTVGLQLGRGHSLEEILDGMQMVAEGVRTAKSAHELALREDVEMPITAEVYRMLYEAKPPAQVVADLMRRPARHERA